MIFWLALRWQLSRPLASSIYAITLARLDFIAAKELSK